LQIVLKKDGAMAYTFRLLRLECTQSQEIGGDEAYLTLDGRKIWEAGRDKMSHDLSHAHRCSEVDFEKGRLLTHEGWVGMAAFDPSAYAFSGLSGTKVVQLWDADLLTSDDLLGETPISEADIGHGHISVLFTRDGAHYRLTYQVDQE
jgi:hypothetical protein